MGLIKTLNSLENSRIIIKVLVTDRIPKFAYISKKTNRQFINHQFDIWHMAKNLKKKLLNLGKKKNCEVINSWIKSIIDHFWWLCSTCNDSSDLLNKKWLSLLYRIRGIHQWQIYCEHEKLADVQQIKKIWLDEKSKAYTELQGVVNDKALLKDFKHVSAVRHTEQLKVYHSWIT